MARGGSRDVILWTDAEAFLVSMKDWKLSVRGIQRHESGAQYLPTRFQRAASSLNYLADLDVLEAWPGGIRSC